MPQRIYRFDSVPYYGEYVTPRSMHKLPVHNWFLYPHSFSRELVYALLEMLDVTPASVVFDPFAGAGTTVLACREKAIPAFGLDQLPLSVFISNTKLRNYDSRSLQSTLDEMSLSISHADVNVFGNIPIIERAFTRETRAELSRVYLWIQSLPDRVHSDFFLLALLRILEETSMTEKSGGWLRFVDRSVDPNQILKSYKAVANKMIVDVSASEMPRNNGLWSVIPGDARYIGRSNRKVDVVIGSPPYLNRHDYTRVFALEMALHFARSNEELISIRRAALRSHVEAKAQNQISANGYSIPDRLRNALELIELRLTPRDTVRLPSMIRGYFEDIYLTLTAIFHRLQPKGGVAFVLSNVRFAGIVIPVDEITAEIGEQVGLHVDRIIVARYRGNSSQQMAKYGRIPVRESIVLWRTKN